MADMFAPKPIKPYLINAVLDYCRDTGATPYLMVAVDSACRVPEEYVRDGRIVFDLSDEAINRLDINDRSLSFQARFGESNTIFDVFVPLNRIIAVTPLEYQQFALQFEVTPSEEEPQQPAPAPRRPTRVK
jgi:stringent starvation protein B